MQKTCDNCKYYHWYYDKCDKWNCEVDSRSVCELHELSDYDAKNLYAQKES